MHKKRTETVMRRGVQESFYVLQRLAEVNTQDTNDLKQSEAKSETKSVYKQKITLI